jgi:putative SOS response-associated peptidase YedK
MTASQPEIALRFGVAPALIMPEPERLPPPELFPKREAFVVCEEDGQRRLDVMTWGFPPPGNSRAPVTNVRSLNSPFWRSALNRRDRRCLVPVTDFCEWEGEKGSKIARWFSVHDTPLFAVAGVSRPTEQGRAFAFLTCERPYCMRSAAAGASCGRPRCHDRAPIRRACLCRGYGPISVALVTCQPTLGWIA